MALTQARLDMIRDRWRGPFSQFEYAASDIHELLAEVERVPREVPEWARELVNIELPVPPVLRVPDRQYVVMVNWSCVGAQTTEVTRQFAAALLAAADRAEREAE